MNSETLDHDAEEALRLALSRAAQPHGVPAGVRERLSARRYQTHSTRPVLIAGLAGAAALTGVGFLATGGRPNGHPIDTGSGRGNGHSPTTVTTPLTLAQLTAEVTQAVDSASDDIFQVNTSVGSGQESSTHWLSPGGNTLRVEILNADGSPLEDATYVKDGTTETITEVDYAAQTWWTGTAPVPQGLACAQFDCAIGSTDNGSPAVGPGAGMVMGAPSSSAGVNVFLDEAGFTKTGQTQTVNGVANAFAIQSPAKGSFSFAVSNNTAFEMQTPGGPAAYPTNGSTGPNVGPVGITMWIDPTTNLPVQVVSNMGSSSITSNVSWLAPTAANQAQLTIAAPAGFSEVSPPAGVTEVAAGITAPTSTTTTTPPTSPTTTTTVPSTSTTSTTQPEDSGNNG